MFVTKRPANGRVVCRGWITKMIFFSVGKRWATMLLSTYNSKQNDSTDP